MPTYDGDNANEMEALRAPASHLTYMCEAMHVDATSASASSDEIPYSCLKQP